MRLSQFHLHTSKETPADAEVISHRLMLRAGMIRKLGAGLYTWTPLGLRVLRKVEAVVREEMERAGAIEVLMPAVQPRELWEETGRWAKFGGQLLKITDRKQQDYCFGPTHEEVITDLARQELASYRQLPKTFFQIQTKFRDEIRPRFGVMRAREFLMKDAYSFHATPECMAEEYRNMYEAYSRIFTRLGLKFRAVNADTGAIGGSASHEFHVLAESGEDAIAFSDTSAYAANVELAEAVAPATPRPVAAEAMREVATPTQKSCEAVAALLGIPLQRTVKSIALVGDAGVWGGSGFVLALVRGDHTVNEIKLAKIKGLADYRLATEEEIREHLGASPGSLGPIAPKRPIAVIADRTVAAMADMVVGANADGYHLAGVNFGRDLPEPALVADIRNVLEGEPSPDGKGRIRLARGIEVGHVFQLGSKYAEAMGATVLNAEGKAQVMHMGCYGIGVSRIVAAGIEQNHDANGICWPEAMAPWRLAVCVINPKNDAAVSAAAEALYNDFAARGVEVLLDDRGLRPGAMFGDIELIGIPHRVVVSERGLAAGVYEYRARTAAEAENLPRETLFERLGV
ncbi:proline--tRNA ligase [Silanimonas sp.]|uniref:proline--tRNA ligase n=1 Tax=Silanimonas sp. TaxID=1929290 RepID=UPI001BB85C5A|nr:proline--tRNA ligase [Silanimonas sp.]MBS3895423.1 proline--tRNA ligase [Silanimonas sp.]MBS3923869.1 proline--tRNA ligase [Xanthomonadaceae bacterium]